MRMNEQLRGSGHRTASIVIVAAGLLALAVYFAVPQHAQEVLYPVIEACSAAVAARYALRMAAPARTGGLLIAAGLGAFAVADTIFNVIQLTTGHPTPLPSVADIVYLCGYPLVVGGAAILFTRSGLRMPPAAMLEAVIVVVIAAGTQWVLVGPTGASAAGTAVLYAYTVGDGLLVASITRGFVDFHGPRRAHVLFLAGALTLLAADILYAAQFATYSIGSWYDAFWLISTVLMAAAVAAYVPRPTVERRVDIVRYAPRALLALMAVALVFAPIAVIRYTLLGGHIDAQVIVIAGSCLVLTGLVFTRVGLLMRSVRSAQDRVHRERRRAEAASARLAAIVAQLQGGVLVEDSRGCVELANSEFCRMFRLAAAPEDLYGARIAELADAMAQVTATPAAFLAGERDCRADGIPRLADVIQMDDGRVIERDFAPIVLPAGETARVWHYRDVSARSALERRLHRSEARSASTLATAPDGVVWVGPDRRIIEFNPAAEHMFGVARAAIIGHRLEELVRPTVAGDALRLDELVGDGASGVVGSRVEMSARDASGREFPVELSISSIEADADTLVTVFVRDITDRRRAESALAAARDAAVRDAEFRARFLATMSHEIRTPMYGVVGTLDLLARTPLGADQHELVGIMQESAGGLLDIINGVLDLSKLEAGKLDLISEAFSIRALVEGVAEMMSVEARRNGLRLVTAVDPDVPATLRGDPVRVRQVLVNLVGNAVKFTESGDVAVHVGCEGIGDGIANVQLTVTDTGVGIPDAMVSEIFKPFTQVDGGRDRLREGTGLGLAISRELVAAMGGAISCRSAVGQGTILSVALPIACAPPDTDDAVEQLLAGMRVIVDVRPGPAADVLAAAVRALGATVVAGPAPGGAQVVIADHGLECGIPVLELTAGETGGHRALPIRSRVLAAAVLDVTGARPQARASLPPPVPVPDLTGPSDTRPRVLLVEDNAVNRGLAVRQLERLGIDCEAVASGQAALRALADGTYHAVLMDCRMPGMDGYETTRRIRAGQTGRGADVPIIALTADSRPEDRDACLEAGMDDHVTKPLTVADLERALAPWLADPSSGRSASAPGPEDTAGLDALVEDLGAEAVARLFATWRGELPARLDALREGIAREDCAAVADAAHVLKSRAVCLDSARRVPRRR